MKRARFTEQQVFASLKEGEALSIQEKPQQWAQLWGLPELPAVVSVQFSRRLRTSLGRCSPRRGIIRLHHALQDAPEELFDEVLCHELAHLAAFRLHGPNIRPHGPEWKRLVCVRRVRGRVSA